MNFKECYKKANDEIAGDSELLAKILATPKKEKTKITPIVYKAASFAAAFVLILTVALTPVIKDKFTVNEEALADEVTETEESAEVLYDTAEPGEAMFSMRMAEEAKSAEAENTAITDIAVANDNSDEFIAYSEDAEELSDGSAGGDIMTPYEMAPGGGSSAVMKSSGPKHKKYTAREVMDFVGISYESLEFADMVLTEDSIFADFSEDGELREYEINILLENGDRKMSVRLTKSESPLALGITDEIGFINAQKTVEGTDVFVTAQNMTKDEVEGYLNKIA